MKTRFVVHLDRQDPADELWLHAVGDDETPSKGAPVSEDDWGSVFALETEQPLRFWFQPGTDPEQRGDEPERRIPEVWLRGGELELWCPAGSPFVYRVEPRAAKPESAAEFLAELRAKDGVYLSAAGGPSGAGCTPLADGRVLFGLYHPTAARVWLTGTFNDWAQPGDERAIELARYRGWFDAPNTWLTIRDEVGVRDEYRFIVQGGVPIGDGSQQSTITDPLTRRLSEDTQQLNSVVVDAGSYAWHDDDWRIPPREELILYEFSVHGLTQRGRDLDRQDRGTFLGVEELIERGYFHDLGVNVLALMPVNETPNEQGPETLGYDPSLFLPVERDFGDLDELRRLVDTAHQSGLAVILDMVFNHTGNNVNLLWQLVLEHPDDETNGVGGLYFSGETPWGNRVATEKVDVQNLLIDVCRICVQEYHVDGFRFDATHSGWMDHGFLRRLAPEVRELKEDLLLIVENLPNEPDLNLNGFDGYAQWCAPFHHKLMALLREGEYMGAEGDDTDELAEIFYFCKGWWAAHTNNVVNYTWSHDEPSVAHETGTNEALNNGGAKDRKGRLAMLATTAALGLPMFFMGQEFNLARPRNVAMVEWPDDYQQHSFYQFSSKLLHLRRRYPALRIHGYDPLNEGTFAWLLGHWMPGNQAGGRKVVGWKAMPNDDPLEEMVILLNFEGHEVMVDIPFGRPGTWAMLASAEQIHDVPPVGDNGPDDEHAIRSQDGWFRGFTLPSSSGFIYKWVG